ncbi:MAG: hypothetical protein KKB38_20495, partial [Gammaproteobacteria bacterium]|nr:hypothetical protein [Gammaproteobacteria bacterium]
MVKDWRKASTEVQEQGDIQRRSYFPRLMSQPAVDTRKALYDVLVEARANGLPSFEKFNSALDNPKKRIALYEAMAQSGQFEGLPEYEIFDRKLFRSQAVSEPPPPSHILERKITKAITEPIGTIAEAITGKPASSPLDAILGGPGRAAVAGAEQSKKLVEAIKGGHPVEAGLRAALVPAEVGMGVISMQPVVAGITAGTETIGQIPGAGEVVESVMNAPLAIREAVAPGVKMSSEDEALFQVATIIHQFAIFGLGFKGANALKAKIAAG